MKTELASEVHTRWKYGFAVFQAIACVTGLGACLSFAIDSSVSSWMVGWDLPGDLSKAVHLSEGFAHGFGAAAILSACLLACETKKRRVLWLAVAITAGSGLLANGLKSGFARVRPHAANAIVVGAPGSSAAAEAVGSQQVVPPSFWDARQRSFPSGHAATAWGLAIGLSLAYPRAWWLFGLLASLASLQRIVSGAHYPSDVLAGAAIAFSASGFLIAMWPRLERRLSKGLMGPADTRPSQ